MNERYGKIQDREIDLKEIGLEFVRGWRVLLLIVILLMLCAFGLGCVKGLENSNSTVESVKRTLEEVEQELTLNEMEDIQEIIEKQEMFEQVSSELENSAYMKIDSYNVNQLVLRYYVKTDSTQISTENNEKKFIDTLIQLYCAHAADSTALQEIISTQTLDLRIKDLYELVTADSTALQTDTDSAVFQIVIKSADMELCKRIGEGIKNALIIYAENLNATIGTHELLLVEESEAVICDYGVLDNQNKRWQILSQIENEMNDQKAALSDVQNEYLELFQQNETAEENVAQDEPQDIPKKGFEISKTKLLLWLVAGVVLYGIYIFYLCVITDKVFTAKKISECLEIPVVGEITKKEKKWRIDRWCEKRKYYAGGVPFEKQLELLHTSIVLLCEKNKISKITLLGTTIKEVDIAILNTLEKMCEQDGIKLSTAKNVLSDAETLTTAFQSENVIFVEMIGRTTYYGLGAEVEICERNQINILGMIAVY